MEEVGFDMKERALENQYLERELNGQIIRLYIVDQVSRETKFVTKTKGEIKVLSFFLKSLVYLRYSLAGSTLVSHC